MKAGLRAKEMASLRRGAMVTDATGEGFCRKFSFGTHLGYDLPPR